jgi:stage II sporulation protein P
LALLVFSVYFCISNDSFQYTIKILSEKSFPFELILLEGAPGMSYPQRTYISDTRNAATGIGMYLLTGVNISDARTYFLSFYAPPSEGPTWLGWAYYPNDPEMEGPLLEPLDNPFYHDPEPVKSAQDVLVGIYHTHSAESYLGDGGADRSAGGENGDIVEIGQLLTEKLNQAGINTAHSEEVNDAVYIQAYNHSYLAAKKMLEKNPTTRLLIDLHRDGLPSQVGKDTAKINGQECARVMIVIGQKNQNWEKNDAIAREIIKIAEKKYPGLFFPKIRYASEARYNQYLTDGAILLEIGSQLNTLEEAQAAAGPIAEVLKEYLGK